MSISICTPFIRENSCFLNFIERYTSFSGRAVEALDFEKDSEGNYTLAVEKEEATSHLETTIKIATMVLTLGLTILAALVIKALTRPNTIEAVMTPEELKEFNAKKEEKKPGYHPHYFLPQSVLHRFYEQWTDDQIFGISAGDLLLGGVHGLKFVVNDEPVNSNKSLENCNDHFKVEDSFPEVMRSARTHRHRISAQGELSGAKKAIASLQHVSMESIIKHFADAYNATNRPHDYIEPTEGNVFTFYSALTAPRTDLLSLKDDKIALIRKLNELNNLNHARRQEELAQTPPLQ